MPLPPQSFFFFFLYRTRVKLELLQTQLKSQVAVAVAEAGSSSNSSPSPEKQQNKTKQKPKMVRVKTFELLEHLHAVSRTSSFSYFPLFSQKLSEIFISPILLTKLRLREINLPEIKKLSKVFFFFLLKGSTSFFFNLKIKIYFFF